MTQVIKCRKLALKSKLGFGKAPDATISQFLESKDYNYIRWVYYNCSSIDFMDEIKAIAGITHTIAKPGTDIEYFKSTSEFKADEGILLKGHTTLKILTYDDKLTFSDFKNKSVREIINLGNSYNLVWIYYNKYFLTFEDEILKELGIDDEKHIIAKPGMDAQFWKLVRNHFSNFHEKSVEGQIRIIEKSQWHKKVTMGANIKQVIHDHRKVRLQGVNHGRVKL